MKTQGENDGKVLDRGARPRKEEGGRRPRKPEQQQRNTEVDQKNTHIDEVADSEHSHELQANGEVRMFSELRDNGDGVGTRREQT